MSGNHYRRTVNTAFKDAAKRSYYCIRGDFVNFPDEEEVIKKLQREIESRIRNIICKLLRD